MEQADRGSSRARAAGGAHRDQAARASAQPEGRRSRARDHATHPPAPRRGLRGRHLPRQVQRQPCRRHPPQDAREHAAKAGREVRRTALSRSARLHEATTRHGGHRGAVPRVRPSLRGAHLGGPARRVERVRSGREGVGRASREDESQGASRRVPGTRRDRARQAHAGARWVARLPRTECQRQATVEHGVAGCAGPHGSAQADHGAWPVPCDFLDMGQRDRGRAPRRHRGVLGARRGKPRAR